MLHIDAKPVDLRLSTPFRISRGVQYTSSNVIVQITYGDITGYGEASPTEYYGESPETALACIALFAGNLGDDPFLIEDILQKLDKILGLNPERAASTSFTIGIDTPGEMAKKALAAKEYPILKIKLGTRHDLEIVKAIREVSTATIRVDANSAWTPKEAIHKINALAPYNIEFVEQPVPAHDLAGLKLVRDNVPLPIISDESSVTVDDIPRLVGHVDGINIKYMKCGGINRALKMIHVARAHNLRVMIGCMIESAIAITAAAHLTPLVDYADLDGNLLIDNDPFVGVTVKNGKLILPDAPGLGVKPRA